MSTVVQKTLADLRDRGGLHSVDIADILSVAPATVARWMRGEAAPDLGTARRSANCTTSSTAWPRPAQQTKCRRGFMPPCRT